MNDQTTGTPNILIVDRNPVNIRLFTDLLNRKSMRCIGASDYGSLDAALASEQDILLVLMDLAGFDDAIWERCRRINQSSIPLLIMSARQDTDFVSQVAQSGASGFLRKPINISNLFRLIYSLVNDESADQNSPSAGAKER